MSVHWSEYVVFHTSSYWVVFWKGESSFLIHERLSFSNCKTALRLPIKEWKLGLWCCLFQILRLYCVLAKYWLSLSLIQEFSGLFNKERRNCLRHLCINLCFAWFLSCWTSKTQWDEKGLTFRLKIDYPVPWYVSSMRFSRSYTYL